MDLPHFLHQPSGLWRRALYEIISKTVDSDLLEAAGCALKVVLEGASMPTWIDKLLNSTAIKTGDPHSQSRNSFVPLIKAHTRQNGILPVRPL